MRLAFFAFAAMLLVACGGSTSTGADAGSDSRLGDGGGGDGGARSSTPCTTSAECDDDDECSGVEACTAGFCTASGELADGTTCDLDGDPLSRDLCVAERCGASRCGDRFVDSMSMEECDDGNGVRGDGCDDCRFTCEVDAECDDGRECNGRETCSADHVCLEGTDIAEGGECASGTGTCRSGVCLPDSCATTADCDDMDVCTGAETCSATMCMPGTALDCDDDNACTADSCAAVSGCLHVPIDGDLDGHSASSLGECGDDCDDTNSMVHPEATEICGDTIDNDCDGTIDEAIMTAWYADCDGDGFAASGARTVSSCVRPAPGLAMCESGGGWTAQAPGAGATDCNDGNASVSPGQAVHQSDPIAGAGAANDFDYDCDGAEERRDGSAGSCEGSLGSCTTTMGWSGDSIPECGQMAPYVIGCTPGALNCSTRTETRTQHCL